MKKLTMKTKPKSLTLSEVWKLYLLDTGTETSSFIIGCLDIFYPNKSRDKLDVLSKMRKYREANSTYSTFCENMEGLVRND